MPLSYAGIGLTLSTPQLEQRLEELQPFAAFQTWDGWSFAGFDLQDLPTPSWPKQPKLAPGVLHWPTGASRPAWFFEVVGERTADAIRDAVGDPMTPRDLVLDDSRAGKVVTVPMYLLPFRPVSQFGATDPVRQNGLILTLTDARFYWQWKRGDITSRPASWAALVAALAGFLGATIGVDAVDSRYGRPTRKWVGYQRPTAAVLDAALAQVGQRLVADLDGTFSTVKYATAKALSDAQIAANDVVISGGLLDRTDIARYVPAAVTTSFARGTPKTVTTPDCASGFALLPNPYEVSSYLGALGLAALYGSASGLPGVAAPVFADFVYDGTNAAAAGDYAAVAATDWYGWRAPDTDLVFPGIEPWAPTGWEDVIEWTYQRRENTPYASTLLRRGPFDQFVSGSWRSGLEPAPCPVPPTVSSANCGRLSSLAGNECLTLTVIHATGRCSCIDSSQVIRLFPLGGMIWESVADFNTCLGSGLVRLDLSDKCCRKLILVGVVPAASGPPTDETMVLDGCGVNDDGNLYMEFSDGSPDICNGYAITTECPSCPAPDGTGTTWAFKVSVPDICYNLEGVYTFEHTAGCDWHSVGSRRGTLTLSGSADATMVLNGWLSTVNDGATYTGAWDCTAATNTLTLSAPGVFCPEDELPPTITLCRLDGYNGCSDDSRLTLRVTCGGCGDTVENNCGCPPDEPLPLILYAHIRNSGTGDPCPELVGDWPMEYGASGFAPPSPGSPYYGGTGPYGTKIIFQCTQLFPPPELPQWCFGIQCPGDDAIFGLVCGEGAQCDPFFLYIYRAFTSFNDLPVCCIFDDIFQGYDLLVDGEGGADPCTSGGSEGLMAVARRATVPRMLATPTVVTPKYETRHGIKNACSHLLPPTSDKVECPSCGGKKTELTVFGCEVFGTCTPGRKVDGIACCKGCKSYDPILAPVVGPQTITKVALPDA